MATVEECREALSHFAGRMSSVDAGVKKKHAPDRALGCHLSDLEIDFRGRLVEGALIDIERALDPHAQIKLTLTSDDLVSLANGELSFTSAWASGRLEVDASVFDLLKLRSLL
jgi:putative sterol carrier protein